LRSETYVEPTSFQCSLQGRGHIFSDSYPRKVHADVLEKSSKLEDFFSAFDSQVPRDPGDGAFGFQDPGTGSEYTAFMKVTIQQWFWQSQTRCALLHVA